MNGYVYIVIIGSFVIGITLGFTFRELEGIYLKHEIKELKALISEKDDALAEANSRIDDQLEIIDLLEKSSHDNNTKFVIGVRKTINALDDLKKAIEKMEDDQNV
jgi:dynactin complex subunit